MILTSGGVGGVRCGWLGARPCRAVVEKPALTRLVRPPDLTVAAPLKTDVKVVLSLLTRTRTIVPLMPTVAVGVLMV